MIQLDNAVSRYRKIILDELANSGIICWLAGGAIRDYFMGIPIQTDHDIFFPNESEYLKAVSYFKEKGAIVKWESDNGMKVEYKNRIFDLVKKFFLNPLDTINNFDFTVSMFAVDRTQVYYGKTSFIDLAKRQLMMNKISYPASTLSRAFRYCKKGFIIRSEEIQKLYLAIRKMPDKTLSIDHQYDDDDSSGDSF